MIESGQGEKYAVRHPAALRPLQPPAPALKKSREGQRDDITMHPMRPLVLALSSVLLAHASAHRAPDVRSGPRHALAPPKLDGDGHFSSFGRLKALRGGRADTAVKAVKDEYREAIKVSVAQRNLTPRAVAQN